MLGNLDDMRFSIIPKDIFICVGYESEEDSFPGVGDELGRPSTRGACPDSTSKGTQSGKVILLAGSDVVWGSKLVSRCY